MPPSPDTSAALLEAFVERGIEWVPGVRVSSIEDGKAVLDDGSTQPFDLFLGVPKHRAPDVVQESGMAENGYIPVDGQTLATKYPGVYAVGDVATVGTPKAGVFAERQASVVAHAILAEIAGAEPAAHYDGTGSCYIEFGGRPGRPRRRRLLLRAEADRDVPRGIGGARRREEALRLQPPRPLVRPGLTPLS